MMKNRDTASNPYRVPRQLTPKWIKVSIVGLFLSNVALIGGVVFLVFSTEQCTKACQGRGRDFSSSSSVPRPPFEEGTSQVLAEAMPRDGGEDPIQVQQESIRLVTRRVDNVEQSLAGLQSTVTKLDEFCRNRNPVDAGKSTDVLITPPDNRLIPSSSSVLEKITRMELKLTRIELRLKEHIASSQQLCKTGHYRYGIHCYYVGEAKLSQGHAKRFCADDYGAKGTLAIIKDKFVHDFIVGKLPNHMNSYWIGIERQQQRPGTWVSNPIRSRLEGGGEGMIPSPLTADSEENPPLAATSSSVAPFDFVDGTKVQNKVWQMWGPKANRYDERERRDCVALSHDKTNAKWHWQDHGCGERLGYVCQYFVLGVGY